MEPTGVDEGTEPTDADVAEEGDGQDYNDDFEEESAEATKDETEMENDLKDSPQEDATAQEDKQPEVNGDVMYDDGIETVVGTGSAQSRSGRRKSNFMRSYSFGANGSVMPPVPNDIAAVWERIHKSVPRLPMNKANAALARSYSFEESVNAMRLQEQLRDAQRKLDKERNARTSLENKRSSLEQERTDLMQ